MATTFADGAAKAGLTVDVNDPLVLGQSVYWAGNTREGFDLDEFLKGVATDMGTKEFRSLINDKDVLKSIKKTRVSPSMFAMQKAAFYAQEMPKMTPGVRLAIIRGKIEYDRKLIVAATMEEGEEREALYKAAQAAYDEVRSSAGRAAPAIWMIGAANVIMAIFIIAILMTRTGRRAIPPGLKACGKKLWS